MRMSSSHFPGGPKPPTRQSRSGDGAPPLCSGGGSNAPGDALRHGRSRKPFTICSCEKCARNSSVFCTYKSLDLKSPGMNSYKKWGWGGACGYAPANRPNRPLSSPAAPAGEGSLRIGLSRPVRPWLIFFAAWRPIVDANDREERAERNAGR